MSVINENQTPRYTISCAGNSLSQREPKGLEYVCIEDHVDMIGMCELTFTGDRGTSWSSLEVGADVEVQLGGSTRKVFVGTITGLRHAYQKGRNTITAIAMDPMVKLAASRRVEAYEEVKDSDVANQVISRAGCDPGTVDSTSRTHDYILQRNESDFNFLRRLAARNGFLLLANEGKIDFAKAQFSGQSTELPKAKVISLDYGFSPRDVPPNLTTYGWDYVAKEMVQGSAGSGDIQSIGGGSNAVSESKIWQSDSFMSDVWVDSQDSAKELATAELNRLARNFLRGRATVQGDGSLHCGNKVQFSGHPSGFNAEAYVVSSRHRIYVRGGFTTELVFCSNTKPT